MSLTGINADYRLKLRPDAQYDFVMSLLNEVSKRTGMNIPFNLSSFSLDAFAKTYSLDTKKLKYLVDDLVSNKGKSIVYAGRTLPEEAHIAVNYLNEILGGKNLYRTDSATFSNLPLSSKSEIESLVSDMNSGKVGIVIHFDSDPVFHFPKDLGYADAIKKVPTVISLTESSNDSSAAGTYTLPINHAFESWGDAKTRTGFYSLQQPVIAPIYDTREKEAILLSWISDNGFNDTIYHEYLMKNWEANVYSSLNSEVDFKRFWYGALHDGAILVDESPKSLGSFNNSAFNGLKNTTTNLSGYAVILSESYSIGDGKYANNGWLQELPHPVSKMTWDNYAAISKNTAKELGVKNDDKISVAVGNRTLEIPVLIQPGCADNTVAIETGYGRTVVGKVGEEYRL